MGIIRHADAGYDKACEIARGAFAKRGGKIPML
jgi:urocanate hydratase